MDPGVQRRCRIAPDHCLQYWQSSKVKQFRTYESVPVHVEPGASQRLSRMCEQGKAVHDDRSLDKTQPASSRQPE